MLVLISGCMMNDPKKQVAENEAKLLKEGIEALEQGSAAPAFSLLIQDGEEVTQAELLDSGGGRLLLFFIPAADTPNTTKNLVELNKHTETIANNGVALALVAPNAPEHLKKYADEFGFSMTMLSDPNGTTAEAYGCFVPGEEEDGEAGEHEHVI